MAHRLTDEMLGLLGRGPVAAADLAQGLKVDRTTVSRALQPQIRAGRVVRLLGATRGARYGRARPIGTVGTSWPLYRIDETGAPEQIATLQAIERNHFHCSTGPSRIARLVEGIPYFLQDARPAGFLGRAIPAAYPVLGLPARVQDWTDEHVIVFLTQAGAESVGNLILGAEALNQYLAGDHGPPIVVAEERATRYPQLAAAAMIGAPPGSSAQGEHPKFAVRIAGHRELVHALVKFSPPRSTAVGERWADLLIAESWALRVLAEQGIPVAHTELHEYGEQVFLQSERFDRVGADGRRGVVTLFSVDADRYGRLDNWSAAADRLRADALLSAQDTERLVLLDTFGSLIANTDRHFGNVTLFDRYEGPFELAPVYDMLPMWFAPLDGQLVERTFEPVGPTAATLSVWSRARDLAERFWLALCNDPRLSDDFRALCSQCLERIRSIPVRGVPRPLPS